MIDSFIKLYVGYLDLLIRSGVFGPRAFVFPRLDLRLPRGKALLMDTLFAGDKPVAIVHEPSLLRASFHNYDPVSRKVRYSVDVIEPGRTVPSLIVWMFLSPIKALSFYGELNSIDIAQVAQDIPYAKLVDTDGYIP